MEYELIDVDGGYRFRPVTAPFDQDTDLPTDERYTVQRSNVELLDRCELLQVWAGVLA